MFCVAALGGALLPCPDTRCSAITMNERSRRRTFRHTSHAAYFSSRREIDIVVAEHVDDYRAAVESLVRPEDVALEVGCAGGKTTDALGRRACLSFGIDKSLSPAMLAEQQRYASQRTRFLQMDATDIGALLRLSRAAALEAKELVDAPPAGFSVILLDISGSVKISSVLDLLERYESCFGDSLRLVVVKSTNHFFGGFGDVARSVHYVDTGLTHLSPYPSNPHQETYHNIERPLWPLDPDPHGIGSAYVPWVRGEEAREGAEVEASVGARL